MTVKCVYCIFLSRVVILISQRRDPAAYARGVSGIFIESFTGIWCQQFNASSERLNKEAGGIMSRQRG